MYKEKLYKFMNQFIRKFYPNIVYFIVLSSCRLWHNTYISNQFGNVFEYFLKYCLLIMSLATTKAYMLKKFKLERKLLEYPIHRLTFKLENVKKMEVF